MHVRPGSASQELELAVDAGVELANLSAEGATAGAVREILDEREFVRASAASSADLDEVIRRFGPVAAIVDTLPGADLDVAVTSVNRELAACHVSPSLVAHDGAPLHIHWTAPDASFGHQVVVDVLMALAHVLCQEGLNRFGRCSAEGCERLFHDTTRNRSRRFCSNSRCASRTHTASHRRRARAGG